MSEAVRTFPVSVQPGIPKLGDLKPSRRRLRIGSLLEEIRRPLEMDDDADYDLVTVKRARGGVVKRERLKGRDISVKSQFYLREGDFLISKRQIVHGACGVVPASLDGSIVSNEYAVLRCKDGLDIAFLNYLSHTVYFQQTCFHSSIGVHVEKMIFKLDDWFKWEFDIPSLPEQKKIAAFLGAVDDKLTALRRKRDLLTDYKRGVMQKLFAQQIRFTRDDGSPFPDWEEKRLGEAIVRVASKYNPRDANNTPVVIDLETIEAGTGQLIDPKPVADRLSIMTAFKKGDVLFGKLRPYLRKFANPKFSGVCSSEIWVLRGRGISNSYLFHTVQTDDFVRLANQSSGSKMPRADWAVIEQASFLFPHPDEQQKIADFLSALDDKIDAVGKQIALTERFKAGLLQQMFV